jgi:hypothetical protein
MEYHDPKECRLAHDVRKARTTGLMNAYELELKSIAAADESQHAEALMQQVRALGRMPRESNNPKECRLAHDVRQARTTGLMNAYELELKSIAAADECRRAIVVATERKRSLETFYHEVDAAVSQNLSLEACRSLTVRLHSFRHDPLLQSTDAQASVDQLAWMLGRQREAFRTQRRQANNACLSVRRRSALASVKATLRQWRSVDDRCNCQPAQPSQPAKPASQPTKPAKPARQASQPASQPSQPSQPASQPSQPRPASQPAQPASPASQPAQPASQASPASQPSQPSQPPKPAATVAIS